MTNFSFDTGVPAAGNNPSVDQPDMLINNQSTDGLIAIDHIGFNANDGGTHKQVTFALNQSAPALPGSTVSELYSNLNNGIFGNIASLFFKNATKNLPLFNLALTTTAQGSGVTTPWGLILNFGGDSTVGTSKTVTFPVAMTNIFAVVACASSPSTSVQCHVDNVSATQFDAIATANGTSFLYIAIGS